MASASQALRQRARRLEEMRREELKRHGADLRKKLVNSAKAETGGNRSFSGMGDRPTLGVKTKTDQGSSTTTVTLSPSPKAAAGPWRWIEEGTKAGRRRRGRRRGSYFHPGTRGSQGREAWSRPVSLELPKIGQALRKSFRAAVKG